MSAAPAVPDFTTLSPKQIDVLFRLLAGDKVADVSRDTGVHRSTIYLWRQQPAFRALYQQACVNRAVALSDKLDCLTDLAIDNVVQILSNQDHSPSVRLRAAKLVIDNALQPLRAEMRQNSTKFDTPELFLPVESPEPVPPTPDPAPEPAGTPDTDPPNLDVLLQQLLQKFVIHPDQPLHTEPPPAPHSAVPL